MLTATATVTRYLVSPMQAEKWLGSLAENQRDLSGSVVARYARDMTEEDWHETADTIKFDTSGKLIDGQHRLQAIVKSGMPIHLWVAVGVDPAAIRAIDTTKVRSASCIMSMHGTANARTVTSIARAMISARRGSFYQGAHRGAVTTASIMAEVENDPGSYQESARWANANRSSLVSPSAVAIAHFIGSKVDQGKTEEFLGAITSGAELKAGSVEFMVYSRLLKSKTANRQALILGQRQKMYLVIRALENFLSPGRKIKHIKVVKRGSGKDARRILKAASLRIKYTLETGKIHRSLHEGTTNAPFK